MENENIIADKSLDFTVLIVKFYRYLCDEKIVKSSKKFKRRKRDFGLKIFKFQVLIYNF